MKAARKTADGRFEIAAIDEPRLAAADWVKARVRMAGICGTDLRHWEKAEEELHCCIMGHELAGEVVEVGPAVSRVAVGDRVLIESVLGCGHCAWCRVQQYNRCPDLYPTRRASVSRAYAEYVVGPQHKFHRLPDRVGELPPSEWSIDYDSLDQGRDEECLRRSTSRRRSSVSCVRWRSCWAKAARPPKRAGGSRSASRPTIAGARNMVA